MTHTYRDDKGRNHIVQRDRQDGFGGIRLGRIWCWSHAAWEHIPPEWRDEEKRLRKALIQQWAERHFSRGTGGTSYPEGFGENLRAYCALPSWKVPDLGDIYEVARMIHELGDPYNRPWGPEAKRIGTP